MNKGSVELDFILEPFGRNTAPAIAAADLHAAQRYGADAQLLVLPADHLIKDEAAFRRDLLAGAQAAADSGAATTTGDW